MEENKLEILKQQHTELLKKQRIEREKYLREFWENLKPFKTIEDIPELPITDKDTWQNFYIPKLIAAGAIPKKDLVDGEYYIGRHRCTDIGKWNENENCFEYWKMKFFPIWDECNHFEDDDGFALFVPIGIGTKEEFDEYSYDNFVKHNKKNDK